MAREVMYTHRSPWPFYLIRFTVRGLVRALFHLEIEGLERLPRQGGYVLACNHLSWLDPILLMVFLPADPHITFLAAQEYTVTGHQWVRKIVDWSGGVIPVDRESGKGNRAGLVRAIRTLRQGGIIGIFPEGKTGTAEGELLPLLKGASGLAANTGAPIQVVGISGTSELYLRRRIRLRVGTVTELATGEDNDAIGVRLADALRAALPPLDPHQPRRKWWRWLTDLPF